jgi:hypothetical protein
MGDGLGITGKDWTVSVGFDGAPQETYDDVLSFEARPIIQESSSHKLGRDMLDIDTEVVAYEGTAEFEVSSAVLDVLWDACVAAKRSRLPYVLSFGEVIKYRNLTSKSYTYGPCQITGLRRRARGGTEKATITIDWKSGYDRVAG